MEQLGYGKLACQPRIIFAALAATVSYIAYCALDPTLVLRLADYGLDQSQKGLVFTIMPTMYMVSTIATPFLLPRWMEVRVWLMIMAFFLGVSMLFVGPICVDKSLVTMCLGLFSTGCLLGPLIIPNMQEMIDAAQSAFPNCDQEHASSLIGGMLNSAYGAGGSIGPLVGSTLY